MLKKISVILLCALFVLNIAGGPLAAGEKFHKKYDGAITAAREEMWKAVTNGSGSGATVAIMDRGHLVMAEGVGVADRETGRRVDANTRFNIGSTSKMFVSTALLLLVDDHKLDLEAPVVKYIPEFKMKDPRYRDITVRMLVNHTSGLPGSSFYFGYEIDHGMHKLLLDTLADSYLKHDPGAMAIYCNDGFTLAEIVVERVSGEKFMDFISRRIFKPLGMKNTGPSVGEAQAKNTAEFYDIKGGKKHPREVIMVYGCGGLSSTAADLCRFCNSFTPYGRNILSKSSLKIIMSQQINPFSDKLKGQQIGNGFGWDYTGHPDFTAIGYNVVAKSGGSSCYTTYMQVVPEQGLIVASSISGSASNSEGVSRRILEALMRGLNLPVPEAKPVRKPAEPLAIPETFSSYAGFYASDTAVVKVRFDLENKKCEIIPAGAEKGSEIKPLATLIFDGEYFVDNAKNSRFYFTTIGNETYIARHDIKNYGADGLAFQKMKDIEKPEKLKFDINGKKWLVRNADQATLPDMFEVKTSVYYEGLPGYVDLGGIKKIESQNYASIAATSFRDQFSLELSEKNGEIWAKTGFMLYSMADGAKKARRGMNRIFIGKENYNQWLSIDKGAILKFEIPKNGRIMVFAPEGLIYDSIVDSNEIYAPEGSFVFCAGKAGDLFRIKTM